QWSATGYDWKNRREEIIAAALAGLQPGAILLLHDIHAETVAALPKILEGVEAAGLEPAELSKLAVRE
ncbi:MAG: polysaccharide deacetylase family protein, partial [Acidobacteria bacterium]